MSTKSWTAGLMMLPLAAATVLATAPAASAKTVAAQASGRCSMGSHWKIKAKPDSARMELELQIDSNRNGQRWTVRISDNRVLAYAATRVTVAPSGAFTVHRLMADKPGVDHFVGVARNVRTGETCVARVNR